jgi:hypothetical protein
MTSISDAGHGGSEETRAGEHDGLVVVAEVHWGITEASMQSLYPIPGDCRHVGPDGNAAVRW